MGYPLWNEFAGDLRREFFKYVNGFNNASALKLIDGRSFPDFFQMCQDLDHARYGKFLSDAFLPRAETPLYARFIESLKQLQPLSILTTNIDEALEQRIPEAAVFQRSDISGCQELLREHNPSIGKLHGSRGAINSAVFTTNDYKVLTEKTDFISTLKYLFSSATVVFLGYSVSDEYVVKLLSEHAEEMNLFGAGPHFVVTSTLVPMPPSLLRITYSLKRFPDHRAALTVLDVIKQARTPPSSLRLDATAASESARRATAPVTETISAYFLSDFTSPGTWETSTTAQFLRGDGLPSELTVGLGFTNEEMPSAIPTGGRDMIIGLTCFDLIYLPLSALGRAQSLLGDITLRDLIQSGVLRFVHLLHEAAIVSLQNDAFGDVGLINLVGGAELPRASIRRQLKAIPGKEAEAELYFDEIETRVIVFDSAHRLDLAGLVRSSVMMPDVARLLGIGEAIVPSRIPLWLKFPYLRLAHLVHTGIICSSLKLPAAKIPFGGNKLASGAFGVQGDSESADAYANYVLTGAFPTDVALAIHNHPAIIHSILRFRDTSEGVSFRREVRERLATNDALEFSAAINAGLAKGVPKMFCRGHGTGC